MEMRLLQLGPSVGLREPTREWLRGICKSTTSSLRGDLDVPIESIKSSQATNSPNNGLHL